MGFSAWYRMAKRPKPTKQESLELALSGQGSCHMCSGTSLPHHMRLTTPEPRSAPANSFCNYDHPTRAVCPKEVTSKCYDVVPVEAVRIFLRL
eukprot:3911443-Amphidinium_carterae.1